LYHLAWEVDTLQDLTEMGARLSERNALVGATDHGTTKALYGKDPDGIEFEVSWLVPADLITDDVVMTAQRLDLPKEIERYGNDTLGGIGISRARPVEA
jgi:catechol-2,3-dioxygenase